jgi:hypothetical protein
MSQHPSSGTGADIDLAAANSRWPRYVGWAGLLASAYIVTVVVVETLADVPTFTDSPAVIRDWYASDRADLVVAVAGAGGLVTDVLLFLPFVLGSGYVLGLEATRDPILTRLSLLGGVMSVPLLWISVMFGVAVHVGGYERLSDTTLVALLASETFAFGSLVNASLALWIGAGGLAILRSGRFPRPVGWLGVGGAVALIMSALWFLEGDPEGTLATVGGLGFLAVVVWMVTLAVSLISHGLGVPGAAPSSGREA